MKLYNIAFTGHRDIVPEDMPAIEIGLDRVMLMGWEREPTVYHTGGASGFDTKVFLKVGYHTGAVNVLHIPFEYQWAELRRELDDPTGENILNYMASMCPLCGPIPHSPKMDRSLIYLYQKRNEHMVDSADLLVTYFNGQSSGTKNCIDYAKRVGKEIVDIRELA